MSQLFIFLEREHQGMYVRTLQTTTVAAQASVSRKDMAVVTAFLNVRSRLDLIPLVGSSLIYTVYSSSRRNIISGHWSNHDVREQAIVP